MGDQLKNKLTFTLKGNLDEIVYLVSSIEKIALCLNLTNELKNQLYLILEELYTNSVRYGFSKTHQPNVFIDISLNDHQLEIIYRDNGLQFDPLQKQDPDLTLKIEDRQIGGLGIFLVKSLTDHVEYSYDGNFNQIRIFKKILD